MKLTSQIKILFILTLFLLSSNSLLAEKYALLIGSNYKGNKEKISELNVSEKDVFFLKNILEKKGKFNQIETLTGKNVTKKKIREAIKNLAKKVKKDDVALIYFSGHGGIVRDPNDKTKLINILVCHESPHITDKEFHSYIDEIKTDKTVLILDCCFSGGLNKKGKITRGFQDVPIGQGVNGIVIQNPEDIFFKKQVVLSSSDADETSIEVSSPINQGLFTYQFGKAFENSDIDKNNMTSLLEVFFKAKKETFKLAKKLNHKQNPQISGNAENIYLIGNFKPNQQSNNLIAENTNTSQNEQAQNTTTQPVKPIGKLLIKSTIIENASYKTDLVLPKDKNKKRKIEIFINDKKYLFKQKAVSSKDWGSHQKNGKLIKGKILHFYLSELPIGVQKLEIRAEGYPKIEKKVAILPETENEIDIISSLKGFGSIQGKVFYKTLDNPVYNQPIFLPKVSSFKSLQKQKTDKNGTFWFTNLNPDNYEILASFAETIPLENSTINLKEGKVSKISIVLNIKLKSTKTKY